MKNTKSILLLAIFSIAGATLLSSCFKNRNNAQLDANIEQHNKDANEYKGQLDQTDNDINNALSDIPAFGKNESGLEIFSSPLCGCTIDSTDIANKILYFNFDGLGAGVRYLTLNSTAASVFDTTDWNSSVWTSTLMQLGTNGAVNTNTATYVAYLWSEVAGFSKFGSYTGNGSSDGPFVFTGMRARYILGKRTDSADEWWIYDTARSAANQANERLQANSSGAELTTQPIDILSNGFKVRSTSSSHNASGGTYIFAAFAESPFKYSLAR